MTQRTIVITGASRGLGLGMAEAWLKMGHRVGACARTTINLNHANLHCRFVDVTDEDTVQSFVHSVEEAFGHIDVWVNNAGVLGPIRKAIDIESSDFDQVMDINVMGVVSGSRAYLQHLRRQGQPGVLFNISSGAGRRPVPGWAAYCASKAAVDMYTRVLQAEAGDLVRAYSVAPGVVDTDMQAAIRKCSPAQFPPVQRFLDLKRDNRFNSPAHVAVELLAMAFEPAYAPDDVICRVADQSA